MTDGLTLHAAGKQDIRFHKTVSQAHGDTMIAHVRMVLNWPLPLAQLPLRNRNKVVLLIMSTCLVFQTAFMCICVKFGLALVPWFRAGQEVGRCFAGPSQNNLLVLGYFLCPLLCKHQTETSNFHGKVLLTHALEVV